VLIAGKYISGIATSANLFTLTRCFYVAALCTELSFGKRRFFLMARNGPPAERGITVLACISMARLFLVIGLFFAT
jgi:hypothetical protein